jgi:hypothetical protein
MKTRMNQRPKSAGPFELPTRFRKPEPSKGTAPFEIPPAWSMPSEPVSHPCVAEAPVRELNSQVIRLARRVEHLQDLLFRVLAEMIRSGNLDQTALTRLDCDKCRAELNGLVERQPVKVH